MHRLLANLVLLAAIVPCAARGECAEWCSRWTCSNTNSCGGCDASVCKGRNPHRMCSDPVQQHCKAPRCEAWCSQDNQCSQSTCSGCSYCDGGKKSKGGPKNSDRNSNVVELAASPSAVAVETAEERPAPVPSCEMDYLNGLKTDLQAKVDAQKARNLELQNSLSPSSSQISPSPASSSPPPVATAGPCVAVGYQCGGSSWVGPTTCCQSSEPGSTSRTCRWFSDAYSGCRDVTTG